MQTRSIEINLTCPMCGGTHVTMQFGMLAYPLRTIIDCANPLCRYGVSGGTRTPVREVVKLWNEPYSQGDARVE